MPDVIGFFGTQGAWGCLSNFWPCEFTVGSRRFCSTEQFIMFQKAQLFRDTVRAEKIMAESDPFRIKKLGRAVSPFDDDLWEKKCESLVMPGFLAKFTQSRMLHDILLETGNSIIVECAPRDRLWGIGMGVSNPDYRDPSKWRGRNRQGTLFDDNARPHQVNGP